MDVVTKNIFISHYGGDEKYVELFKSQIGNNIRVRDGSIVETEPNNATNESYIKYKILAPQIEWAGTVVVLIGSQTKYRDYVNWEIDYAIKHDKRIVGVYLPNSKEDDIPENLKKYGDALVTWDATKITSAIAGNTEWETPSGAKRPITAIRGTC